MADKPIDEKEVFSDARQIVAPEERKAYLQKACGHDPAAMHRIQELLRVYDQERSFLESSPVARGATIDEPIVERPGTVIGPYKLLQQIGEGGMGVVWMAEQTQPVQRKVALKVIKPGMDSRQVVARFEAERQALAMMDHVHIARVFDGGATETGRPYFVMELVHGVPITKYCDDNHLTPRERLELFVPVCQAIQHAHQKGIIHRDIKPSNVMVTLYDGKPVPKVIDFGVAKATEQKLTDRTLFTQYGTMVGTLEYMSPEQAEMSALGVDTRSDIYSLGVLLYELLTGNTPLTHMRMKEAAYAEILRMIKEEEPPKPSTRLSDSGEALASISANRHTEPAKLTKLVRGELDWIVMKTLEKDRNRRYETAKDFAADVQRYLGDEPVQACPPSAAYRFRKFSRRNKRILATAGVIVSALVLGTAVSTWQAIRATEAEGLSEERLEAANANYQVAAQQRQRAETSELDAKKNLELADENLDLALQALDEVYMKEIEKRVRLKRELSTADRDFLNKGLRFYEEFGKRNSTHAGLQWVQWATAKANRRAGYLRLELAQWQEAGVHFRRAIPLLEELATQSPTVPNFRRELASTHHGLSIGLPHTGALPEAETTCRQAIVLWRQLSVESPTEREYRVQLGHSLWQLRIILSLAGNHEEAEKVVREALTLYEKLTVEFPEQLFYRQETAFSHRHLARVLVASNRLPEAVEHLQRTAVHYAGLVAKSPDNVTFNAEMAHCYVSLGEALKDARRIDEAERAFRDALAVRKKLVAVTKDHPEHRARLFAIQGLLAAFLAQQGKHSEAIELCTLVIEAHSEAAWAWSNRGGVYAELGQWKQAAADFAKAVELKKDDPLLRYRQALVPLQRGDAAGYRKLCTDMVDQFDAAAKADSAHWVVWTCVLAADAVADWKVPLQLSEKAVADNPKKYRALNHRGAVLYRAGKYHEALNRLTEAEAAYQSDDEKLYANAYNWLFLAMAHHRLGQVEEANKWHDKAVRWIDKETQRKPKDAAANSLPWNRRLTLQLLRREAEELLAAKSRP